MRVLTVTALLAACCAGCTHHQLARSTLGQAKTVTDIQYRQVLTNLAMTHCTPDVLPQFAVVGSGGTLVNDQGTAGVELEWNPYTLVREQLGLGGTREVEEQWTLAPVVNPDKLRAIRCAFQLVAHGTSSDPDYNRLLTSFLGEDYAAWIPRGWYGVGGWKDVPKGACHVARYRGTWVWVTPDGIDGLTRLTIAILNITTLDANVPPEQPTKTVYKYTYKDGRIDTLEVMTRPDPDAPKSAGPAQRKDFYNPLQSQIQLGGRGR
jgi:hypothetical protein